MEPYYVDPHVTLYHADWREVPADLLRADVLVTDPPYGMAWNTDTSRFGGGSPASVSRRGAGRADRLSVAEDDQPFDPAPWLGYPEAIMFGSNHYAQRLPVGTTLVWVKRYDDGFGSFLSDAEVAWMKSGHGVYCFRDLSMTGQARSRSHPTQKPVSLMRWCINKTKGGCILDPFAGSGTTLVAAKSLGRKSIGVEIEERYCEVAANRLRQEVLGLA